MIAKVVHDIHEIFIFNHEYVNKFVASFKVSGLFLPHSPIQVNNS